MFHLVFLIVFSRKILFYCHLQDLHLFIMNVFIIYLNDFDNNVLLIVSIYNFVS